MKQSDLNILLHEGEGSMLECKEALSSSFAREEETKKMAKSEITKIELVEP